MTSSDSSSSFLVASRDLRSKRSVRVVMLEMKREFKVMRQRSNLKLTALSGNGPFSADPSMLPHILQLSLFSVSPSRTSNTSNHGTKNGVGSPKSGYPS